MIEFCQREGLRTPEFSQRDDFRVAIWRKAAQGDVTPDVTPNVTPAKLDIRIKDELTSILVNKHITAEELALKFSVSVRTIRRDFKLLRKQYAIDWIPLTQYTGY